jgi:2-polyprenyl-6-methoxyphenol hydroxylase-like FAD-dependent oxidoreductase
MNTGLVDAIVLAEALIEALRQGQPTALDRYGEVRRPAASEVLELASRLTRMATARTAFTRLLRNVMLRVLNGVQPFKRQLAMRLSGISRRGRASLVGQ